MKNVDVSSIGNVENQNYAAVNMDVELTWLPNSRSKHYLPVGKVFRNCNPDPKSYEVAHPHVKQSRFHSDQSKESLVQNDRVAVPRLARTLMSLLSAAKANVLEDQDKAEASVHAAYTRNIAQHTYAGATKAVLVGLLGCLVA